MPRIGDIGDAAADLRPGSAKSVERSLVDVAGPVGFMSSLYPGAPGGAQPSRRARLGALIALITLAQGVGMTGCQVLSVLVGAA